MRLHVPTQWWCVQCAAGRFTNASTASGGAGESCCCGRQKTLFSARRYSSHSLAKLAVSYAAATLGPSSRASRIYTQCWQSRGCGIHGRGRPGVLAQMPPWPLVDCVARATMAAMTTVVTAAAAVATMPVA